MFPIIPKETIIYANHGSRYFEIARIMERTLAQIHIDPKNIIFQLKNVFFLDHFNLELFRTLITNFQKRGVMIYLCEAVPGVKLKLESTGIIPLVNGRLFNTLEEVLEAIPQKRNKNKKRGLKRLILTLLPFKLKYKLIKLVR